MGINPFDFLFPFLETAMLLFSLKLSLESRVRGIPFIAFFIVHIVLGYVIPKHGGSPVISAIAITGVDIVITILFYKGSLWQKSIATIIPIFINIFTDTLVFGFHLYILGGAVTNSENDSMTLVMAIISKFIGVIGIIFIWLVSRKRKTVLLPRWISIALLTVVMLDVARIFINVLANYDIATEMLHLNYADFFLSIGSIALIILIGVLYAYMTKQIFAVVDAEHKVEIAQVNIALEKKRFMEIQSRVEEINALRHDMNKILQTILYDARKHDTNAVIHHVQSVLPHLNDHERLNYCEDLLLDTVFSKYAGIAKKHGIEYTVQVEPGIETLPDALDLVIILENLLDNAVDACISLTRNESKIITVELMDEGQHLSLLIRNSANMPIFDGDGNYMSQKRQFQTSGYGLSNVKRIVQDKYGGLLHTEFNDHFFETLVEISHQ